MLADMSASRPEHRRVTAVFGGVKRAGRWQVPRKFSVNVLMGGAQIDLRDCDLPPGPTELKVRCLGGGIAVIVRPDVVVDLSGFSFLGGFNDKSVPPAAAPEQSLLRISGFTVMGGLHVWTRPPDSEQPRSRERDG